MSTSRDIYFAIPSANPENCHRTLPVWREMGYKVAVLQNRTQAEIPADIVVWSDEYPGWAGSNNLLCQKIVPQSCQLVVCGGDDMLPDPTKTAQQIADEYFEHFAKSPEGSFGVMQPHGDPYDPPTICGSPWLGRAWFSRMYQGQGGMCSAYKHFWTDDELYWVSRGWDALWIRKDLRQEHQHFFRTGQAKPEYWAKNVQGNDAIDTQMFIARSGMGFPLHGPAEKIAGRGYDQAIFQREYTQRAEKHWAAHYAHQQRSVADLKVEEALAACAARGEQRVALIGAGKHTRKLSLSLQDPPVEVVAIIDENSELHGSKLWNYPIVSIARALELDLDAIIISSDSAEQRLTLAAEPLRAQGVRLAYLYLTKAQQNEVNVGNARIAGTGVHG